MASGLFKETNAKVWSQLLEYYKLVTYAMMNILERLKKVRVMHKIIVLYIDIYSDVLKSRSLKEVRAVMFTSPSKLEKIKAQFNTAHSKDQT